MMNLLPNNVEYNDFVNTWLADINAWHMMSLTEDDATKRALYERAYKNAVKQFNAELIELTTRMIQQQAEEESESDGVQSVLNYMN